MIKEIFQKGDGDQTTGTGLGTTDTGLPVLVRIRPGTAAEKSMRFLLPEDKAEEPVTSIVQYALGLKEEDGLNREFLRIQERIQKEMGKEYGVSINGQAISGNEKISTFLRKATSTAGKEYLEAEIIVAARQEGASLEHLC